MLPFHSKRRSFAVAITVTAALAFPMATSTNAVSQSPFVAAGSVALTSTSPFRVVVLGDSVPAGTHCSCNPFPIVLGWLMEAKMGRPILVTNHAVSGMTSGEMAEQTHSARVMTDLRQANVIIVMVGANDTPQNQLGKAHCLDVDCFPQAIKGVTSHLVSTVLHLRSLHHVAGQRIIMVTYWNVWQDGMVGRAKGAAFVSASREVTTADNTAIRKAASHRGIPVVSLDIAFRISRGVDDTDLLAPDGDHPNARGHRAIANAIVQQVPSLLAG